jgi:hypothetical protein
LSDTSGGPGWWQASDGKWYPPEQHPDARAAAATAVAAATTGRGPIGRPRKPWLTILVTIVTFGIWSYLWSYWNGEELKRYRRTGLGGLLFLLFQFLLYPIVMFIMANEVEQMYREEGEEPLITTVWGLWFLLPLIGNLIWYFRIQRSINDYWTSHGSTVSPGL